MTGAWQIRESLELHLTAIADAMVRERAPDEEPELVLVAVKDGAMLPWVSIPPPAGEAWLAGRRRFARLASVLGADGLGASTLVRGRGPDGQALLVELAVAGAPPAALLVPVRLGSSRPGYWREGAFSADSLAGAEALLAGTERSGAAADRGAEAEARRSLAAVRGAWGPATEVPSPR